MPAITFISHSGYDQEVEAEPGTSVMQAAVDNGVDGILAECGGACSCATCHCFVADEWLAKLPEPDKLELQMIECAVDPGPNSRLSCQLVVTDELDGLVVRLPARQF